MALTSAIEQVLSTSVDDLVLEQVETTENTGMMTGMMENITNMLASLVNPNALENRDDSENEFYGRLTRMVGDQTSLTVASIDRVEEAVIGLQSSILGIDEKTKRQRESERMDELERLREEKTQPDYLPFSGTPEVKQEKKEEKSLLSSLLGGLKSVLLGSAGGMAAMGVVGAFKGVLSMGTKFAGIMKKAFLPLTVVVGLWEGVTGFVEGFNENADDSGIQKIGRGLIQGLTNIIDTLVMKTLDMFKSVISWAAGKLGFDQVEEFLDSFSFSDIYRSVMKSVEELYIGLWGWIEGLVGDVKNLINSAARYMGMDPIFDTKISEQDMAVPGIADSGTQMVMTTDSPVAVGMTESQYNDALAAGTIDLKRKENQDVALRFKLTRERKAQDAVDNIIEAVDRGMPEEEAAARLQAIKREYPGVDINGGLLKRAGKAAGWLGDLIGLESSEPKQDMVPVAGRYVEQGQALSTATYEQQDMKLQSASVGGGVAVSDNSQSTTNVSNNSYATGYSPAMPKDDGDRTWPPR